MYLKRNPGPVGVSPGATIGDMIQNSRMKPPRTPMPRQQKPMNEDMIQTTVDFKSTPAFPKRGMR